VQIIAWVLSQGLRQCLNAGHGDNDQCHSRTESDLDGRNNVRFETEWGDVGMWSGCDFVGLRLDGGSGIVMVDEETV